MPALGTVTPLLCCTDISRDLISIPNSLCYLCASHSRVAPYITSVTNGNTLQTVFRFHSSLLLLNTKGWKPSLRAARVSGLRWKEGHDIELLHCRVYFAQQKRGLICPEQIVKKMNMCRPSHGQKHQIWCHQPGAWNKVANVSQQCNQR